MSLKIIKEWDELEIQTKLLRGIYAHGFEKPSPIQQKAILPIIEGRDVIAQAQSGTGKTGCFTIAALQKVDIDNDNLQIIILSPTRELSQQIKSVIDSIAVNMKELKINLFIGGTNVNNDIMTLYKNPPHIAIGCPGRIHDLIKRKSIDIEHIKMIVLDEADEMLSIGFKDQIYNILQYLSNDLQVVLFSATIPKNLYSLTNKIMRDPVEIIVKTEMLTLEGIVQYYVNLLDDEEKYETIKDLFSVYSLSQCIIYCNSVKRVQELYNSMINDEFPVTLIHSNLDKEERLENYNSFSSGKKRVLISSNVTARGIDIQQVSTVINYDIPKSFETYLHRIGRSGRWGRKGTAINLITKRDVVLLKEIETFYSTEIKELPSNYK